LKPYRTHLLVCAGTGCVSSGAFALKDALEKEIAGRGLEDEVLVVATGCNGFCERGPIVIVHPDNIFYQRLTRPTFLTWSKNTCSRAAPCRNTCMSLGRDSARPRMSDIEFFKHQRLVVLRNRGRIDRKRSKSTSPTTGTRLWPRR